MNDYEATMKVSRGSSLYYDKNGCKRQGLEEIFRFTEDDGRTAAMVQEITRTKESFTASWRPVRPIPENDDFFENVWRSYRENKNTY